MFYIKKCYVDRYAIKAGKRIKYINNFQKTFNQMNTNRIYSPADIKELLGGLVYHFGEK